MRRLLGVFVLLGAMAGAPAFALTAQEQVENHRADAAQRVHDGPSMWRVSARFDGQERAREARTFYDGIRASLAEGDCEGARAKAVDAGRHELAARIRRACKANS